MSAPPSTRPAPETGGPPRRPRSRRATGLVVGLVALVVVLLASLAVGARAIPPETVLDVLLNPTSGSFDAVVVLEQRLPRTLLGLAVGLALGGAGALMQALTRNPLADPGVLGITWGASAAVVLGIVAFGVASVTGYVWFALVGSAVVAVVVYLLGQSGRSGATPARLALAGTAIGASLQGAVYAVVLVDSRSFDQFRVWRVGSLSGRDPDALVQVLPFLAVGALLALGVCRALNALALGEETGRALGVKVPQVRVLTGLAIVLLCGGATAACGPIAFVGLAVPHFARWVTGPDQRWVVPYSMVLGAVLVVGADVVGRVAASPAEVEVGVVTAFVGAPVFLAIARRRRVVAL
ncbi:FecCD family ABC transporter permease [Actinomycetospora termitidis]|uniref:Iron chelate uptake ABC transporter family permease subunit n=1 Tax=Actinomycetospora termitidis TaxID=3053470 RepID=A0ABT7MI08_9PSEU|nr:iron chelate uptake ABC transporter family permease subunit [Actinomycetospora sp. Odt1-22]MDL5159527.1 iron chelate uptake ABC transporter family permease subunit [Actinomycetospora sp. Odt1-22]